VLSDLLSRWLETPRLALRRFAEADLDWLSAFYSDPVVTRYLGGVKSRQEVAALLQSRGLDYYEAHPGLGMWLTLERATGTPVGFHVLNHVWGEPDIQVGFGLLAPAWGRGYGTEMALALVRHGFRDLGLPRIVGIASRPNAASHRVLTKIGLRRREDRLLPHPAYASEGPMAWFDRERREWLDEFEPSSTAGRGEG
jgi:RimJ/RimL family protein N-acetyltransferase